MLLIPAIDLRGGQVVRLYQGRFDREKQYHLSPDEVAARFKEAGAKIIHVVDLDGAREGKPLNKDIILELARTVPIKIEVGGGIRNMETIREYLEAGVNRVILGTIAHSDQELVEQALKAFPKKIVIGIDAKAGRVAISGWEEKTGIDAAELAQRYNRWEVRAIIYTEIERDGALQGPAVAGTERLLKAVQVPVIASGGVSSLEDLKQLKPLGASGLEGVIVGKAIYEKQVDVREAIRLLES
jgi:phosphoribosylformimino-5-aminoimidazole carboxamide ribotide isomerase